MYSKLAKNAAEHFVKYGEYISPPKAIPSELLRQQACYITIIEKLGSRVRSMYGQVLPRQTNLAHEIIYNTSQAAMGNNANRPVVQADLPNLRYSVALLGPLQRISDKFHLDPQQYGLFIQSDRGKVSLLLPQRVGVETAEDQIATALRESGINKQEESFTMYRFEVNYYDS